MCVESKNLNKWTNKTNRLINAEKLMLARGLGGGNMSKKR